MVCSKVPSAYLAVCGIKREVKKPKIRNNISIKTPVKCESDSPIEISVRNFRIVGQREIQVVFLV